MKCISLCGMNVEWKFHFLNGISEINQLFDDILIIWPAPVCLWRWKLASPEQLSAWTIGTDHVIIAERIFSPWVTSPLESQVDYFPHYMSERERRRCVQFYVNKTGCSPSLSDITSASYAVSTVGTDRQKHKFLTKQEPQCCAEVCSVCLPHVYIWNNEPERAKDVMWTAISSCGAPFLWREE